MDAHSTDSQRMQVPMLSLPPALADRYSMDNNMVVEGNGHIVVNAGHCIGDQRNVAIKIIDRKFLSKNQEYEVQNEATMMQSFDHPHLVKAFDFAEEQDYFFIVSELLNGGELFERVSQKAAYSEKDARDLAFTMLGAVQYLHEKDIVHR